ncbi:hypothetical protein T4C_9591 [Trichinella pseudospiralis]|uniref:Uncharacterized protein n=1 Tax=Trichinella pseudospiralis TaxID=6337 RepID=A0A0V1JV95_TRIPS|nr:hypothetical protein T4C_9591 [Trichinella pseudospiralis]
MLFLCRRENSQLASDHKVKKEDLNETLKREREREREKKKKPNKLGRRVGKMTTGQLALLSTNQR